MKSHFCTSWGQKSLLFVTRHNCAKFGLDPKRGYGFPKEYSKYVFLKNCFFFRKWDPVSWIPKGNSLATWLNFTDLRPGIYQIIKSYVDLQNLLQARVFIRSCKRFCATIVFNQGWAKVPLSFKVFLSSAAFARESHSTLK